MLEAAKVLESESRNNGFLLIVFLILSFMIMVVISIFGFFYFGGDSDEGNKSFSNDSLLQSNVSAGSVVNVSDGGGEGVNGSLVGDDNSSDEGVNESVFDDGSVPNPTGSIKIFKIKDDEGEYFCNNVTNSEHGVRVYTYRIVNGVKNLSEEFVDSAKVNNLCDHFNVNVTNYYIKWEWEAVEGIDGYRIYQHYALNNITKNYNYYVDMKVGFHSLIDMGLDFWVS